MTEKNKLLRAENLQIVGGPPAGAVLVPQAAQAQRLAAERARHQRAQELALLGGPPVHPPHPATKCGLASQLLVNGQVKQTSTSRKLVPGQLSVFYCTVCGHQWGQPVRYRPKSWIYCHGDGYESRPITTTEEG